MSSIAVYFYESCPPYFDEPIERVKIQTSKNMKRYYTLKHLIRDLLSTPAVASQ